MKAHSKPIRSLISGQLCIEYIDFKGRDPKAPSVYIQAGIHGDELQGFIVAQHLIDYFSSHPPLGDIRIVPLANAMASNAKTGEYTYGRFCTDTGENWNRHYLDLVSYLKEETAPSPFLDFESWVSTFDVENPHVIDAKFKEAMKQALDKYLEKPMAYHKKLCAQLQRLSIGYDTVLDLHCDSGSVPYVYTPSYALESAAYFGFEFCVSIPKKFGGALDEAAFYPWWCFQEQLHQNSPKHFSKQPKFESFALELGDMQSCNLKDLDMHLQAILSYLYYRGSCEEKVQNRPPSPEWEQVYCEYEDFVNVWATEGGFFHSQVQVGQKVNKGDVLGVLYRSSVSLGLEGPQSYLQNITKPIVAPENAYIVAITSAGSVHEGMDLFRILRSPKSITRSDIKK